MTTSLFYLVGWKVTREEYLNLPDGVGVLRPDISFILNENFSTVKGHIQGVPKFRVEKK
ncbi:MAG: hypothetical protein O9301_00665 [Leptospira sp.]|nr:hypothetical protein [Leptospira sp.]